MFQRYSIAPEELLDRDALSIEKARELARDRLVTIGSHCLTHKRLSLLSEEEARREISESRPILEAWLQVPVRHIAYPFGGRNACGEREFQLAKAAAYRSGVTTRRENIFPRDRRDLLALPRRGVGSSRSNVRNCLYGTETLLRV